MKLKSPAFWYTQAKDFKEKTLSTLLWPLGKIYSLVSKKRFDFYHAIPMARPVICVGNLVAGGAGKTPVVLSLIDMLLEKGYNPHILTRGYGGTEEGPLQVAPSRDTAEFVGDEALLLVEKAPTWVAKNRALGAQAAIDTGANIIVMDDGFQNPGLFKDFSILVVDGGVGFGNKRTMPAGPLREDISFGLARAQAVVIIGEDKTDAASEIKKHSTLPIFYAQLKPAANNPDLFGKNIYAFAGIGRPEKFKASLMAAGAMIEGWGDFPDHYKYQEQDLKDLITAAEEKNAPIVTTTKDYVRLPESIKPKVQKFAVYLEWQDPQGFINLVDQTIKKNWE